MQREFRVRILALAALGVLLSVKSDRYFPLPENIPEPVFQALLIPYTCCFMGAIALFLFPRVLVPYCPGLDRISATRLTTAIVIMFEAMALVLLGVQDIRYASFGYLLDIPLTVLIFIPLFCVLVFLLARRDDPRLLFFTSLAAYTGTYLLSIVSFPLNSLRSDMLPLIADGCRSFLAGISPYGFHDIPRHLIFTYLPGMWMAYLPAVAAGADPRFVNLGCIVAAALILTILPGSRRSAMLLLPVFFLTPYLQYRHEIYLGVVFLILAVLYVLAARNRRILSAVVSGYALTVYQFLWVLFPFGIVAAWKRRGRRSAALCGLAAVAVALAIVLPFYLGSPEYFTGGVYGHWLFTDLPGINLFFLVSQVVPAELMVAVQCGVAGIVLLAAVFRMDPADCWGWMAAALFLFIALNHVISQYYYLLVLFLLVLHGISTKEDPPRHAEPGGSGSSPPLPEEN